MTLSYRCFNKVVNQVTKNRTFGNNFQVGCELALDLTQKHVSSEGSLRMPN